MRKFYWLILREQQGLIGKLLFQSGIEFVIRNTIILFIHNSYAWNRKRTNLNSDKIIISRQITMIKVDILKFLEYYRNSRCLKLYCFFPKQENTFCSAIYLPN